VNRGIATSGCTFTRNSQDQGSIGSPLSLGSNRFLCASTKRIPNNTFNPFNNVSFGDASPKWGTVEGCNYDAQPLHVGHVEHRFLASPRTKMAWRLFVNSESCLVAGYPTQTRAPFRRRVWWDFNFSTSHQPSVSCPLILCRRDFCNSGQGDRRERSIDSGSANRVGSRIIEDRPTRSLPGFPRETLEMIARRKTARKTARWRRRANQCAGPVIANCTWSAATVHRQVETLKFIGVSASLFLINGADSMPRRLRLSESSFSLAAALPALLFVYYGNEHEWRLSLSLSLSLSWFHVYAPGG